MTKKSSSSAVLGKQRAVLLVHADWCPHCRHLVEPKGASVWDAVKEGSPPHVPFVEVDYNTYNRITANTANRPDTAVMKTVQGFPFIAVVEKADKAGNIGVRVYQGGDRTAGKLRRFVQDSFKRRQ
jgi:thiol-disulfide isomerase/thioredoxin